MFSNNHYMSLIENRRFQDAFDYRASTIPDYVYKFISLGEKIEENEKRFDTLKSNQLWFAAPSAQNDPYEFQTMFLDAEKLHEIGFSTQSIDSVKKQMMTFAICCFVDRSSDNLPMWAHYANQHKGYCVKYKVKNKYAIRNVVYEPKRIPIASIFANFIQEARKYDEGKGEISNVQFYTTIMQENYFLKHSSWSSENEYRAIYPLKDADATGMRVDIDKIGLEINEIICGYKCKDIHVERLKSIADDLKIPCKICSISETNFTVLSEA